MPRTLNLAHLRATATGERRQAAVRAITTLPARSELIPEAGDGQARLESLFLAALNSFDHVGHPADPPFGIARCTPAADQVTLEVARPLMSAVLAAVLPLTVPSEDLYGVPGLRAHHHRDHLVLQHLRLAGRIRIRLPHPQWRRIRNWLRTGLPAGTSAHWVEHPLALTRQEEESLAWRPQTDAGAGAGQSNRLMSAMLRRLHLLRGQAVPGCDPFYNVWFFSVARNDTGARLLNLEWGSRPTSLELAELLTEPGSPIALPEPLRVHTHVHGGDTPWVRIHTALDGRLLLRHNPLPGMGLEPHLPTSGGHRPPRRPVRTVDDLTALDLVLGALTAPVPLLERADLHVARRRGGGWTLTVPRRHFELLEHLRRIAHSPAHPNLWPADVEDVLSLWEGRSLLRVRGVDFVFQDAQER